MIVPMKRITLVCLADERDTTLDALRDLGAVHLTPMQEPEGEDLAAAQAALDRMKNALAALPVAQEQHVTARESGTKAAGIADAVHNILARRKAGEERRQALLTTRDELAPYGDFDSARIAALAEKGVHVKLYSVSVSDELATPEGAQVVTLTEAGATRYLAIVAREDFELENVREFRPGPRSLAELTADIAEAEDELAALASDLAALAATRGTLSDGVNEAADHVMLCEAQAGMGKEGKLAWLQGYCPDDRVATLRKSADECGWGLIVDAPAEDEAPPTLIRSPKWVRPVKPLFDFLSIVPGYREIDISGAFLIFYSIFFAMLVGDAGYGLLFLGLAALLRRLVPKTPREVTRLLGLLSVCTILWGALTGTWFSISPLPAPLAGLRIDWLRNDTHLMGLCFLLGAIHLSIAHAWVGLRVGNFFLSLAEAAWIAVTWTMYFAARTLIMDEPFPGWVMWMFIPAVAIIVLFMTPPKALRQEFHKHIMLPMALISNFGDLVSYVRLFAVGSATAAISVAFNGMAIGDGISGVGDALVAAIILLAAHGLNIILCGLAVIVHGVRLNTLEFCGHMGIQWTGFAYRPFARYRIAGEGHTGQDTNPTP